jgi:hypothetical protein
MVDFHHGAVQRSLGLLQVLLSEKDGKNRRKRNNNENNGEKGRKKRETDLSGC